MTRNRKFRPPRTLLGALLLLLAALPATGPAAAVEPPRIAPEEITPGMTGYGLTVFAGTAVDTFGVTVIGVQPNIRAAGSLILIEVSGHGLETSSIAQGMSGSPVFIEGRLAGALAFGWGGALRPIAGVTPIDEMLAMPRVAAPPAEGLGAGPPPPAWSSLGTDGALAAALFPETAVPDTPSDAATPAGWPAPEVLAHHLFGAHGAAPEAWFCRPSGAALPAQGAGAAAAPALAPGSACAVPLVLGDALLGAVGTVTWVEDSTVWMMGHPFMQRGPVALPLATAEILTLFPSRQMSFKMGSIGEVVGTVHHDQRAGLVGDLGAEPPLVPVDVTVARPGGEREYSFEVADDPMLAPSLVFWAAYNALLVEGDDASLQTIRFTMRTRWSGDRELAAAGLVSGGATAGPGGAMNLGREIMTPLSILLANPYRRVELEGVEIRFETVPGLQTATITGVTAPARLPAAGGPLTVQVEIQPRAGQRRLVPVTLQVPGGLEAGRYRLVVGSAAEFFALEGQRAPERFQPRGLAATVRLLTEERSFETLTVALLAPGRGMVVEGEDLANLPGSVARSVRRGGAGQNRTLADYKARRDTPQPWLLQGHAIQDLSLGDQAKPITVEKRP